MIVEKSPSPSEVHSIGHKNWVEAEGIRVTFSIGHDGTNIYLSYKVEEPQVRAVNTDFNSSVWEDSCVEFFFAPRGDCYYNFEMNAIGTLLCGYGKDRHSRQGLDDMVLSKVQTRSSLGRNVIEKTSEITSWKLEARIPVEVLVYSEIEDLTGLEARGNFYKCGDMLDFPHYLSWNPVQTPDPNFHLPEHFGQLSFE
jgi:hypothetical protein